MNEGGEEQDKPRSHNPRSHGLPSASFSPFRTKPDDLSRLSSRFQQFAVDRTQDLKVS